MEPDNKDNDNQDVYRIRNELFRKFVHILGFSIPVISFIVGITVAIVLMIMLSVVYSISEYMRLKGYSVPVFTTVTKMATRNYGREKLDRFIASPLMLALGILATILIFPAPNSYCAIAVVTLGDGFASVVGRMYGKNRIPFSGGKTLEGTAAGILFAFVGGSFFVSPVIALTAAVFGMIVEFLPLRINDNVSVPLFAGLSITIIQNLSLNVILGLNYYYLLHFN